MYFQIFQGQTIRIVGENIPASLLALISVINHSKQSQPIEPV